MKVLMIYDHFSPVTGGIESHVEYLLKNLPCNTTFLTLKNKEYLPSYENRGNFEIYRVPLFRFYAFFYFLLGARLIVTKKINLIHAHTIGVPAWAAILLGKLFNRPVVITIHESGFLLDISKNRKFAILKHRLVLKLAKKVIATSEELRGNAINLGIDGEKIIEIPNGVDLDSFKFEVKLSTSIKKIILCPRRITPKNGLIYLVEAIPEVLKAEPTARFLFVGPVCDKEYRQFLYQRVKDLSIEEFVEFKEDIIHSKMPKIYSDADIVVLPSLMEAISLSALEAMASGKPVIATYVGGLKEIIKSNYNGLLVNPADSKALSDAIIFMLKNPNSALGYGRNARSTVKQCSWRSIAVKTFKVYLMTTKRGV